MRCNTSDVLNIFIYNIEFILEYFQYAVFKVHGRPAFRPPEISGSFLRSVPRLLRRMEMERTVLKREEKTIVTPLGEAQVKVCEARGVKRFYPEYESAAQLAEKNQTPFSQVYQMIQKQCMEEL